MWFGWTSVEGASSAQHTPRGWTEQEPSICAGTGYPVPVFQIPIPAEPVQDIWQEKSQENW